jgi:hypothetical protein
MISSDPEIVAYKKQVRDVRRNDIRFHPARLLVDPVMFRKLDKRGAILYVMLVCVLLPLCCCCRRCAWVYTTSLYDWYRQLILLHEIWNSISGTHQNLERNQIYTQPHPSRVLLSTAYHIYTLAGHTYSKMPPKKGPKPGSSRLTSLPAEYPGKISGKGLEQPQWAACRAMLEGVYIAKNGPWVCFIVGQQTGNANVIDGTLGMSFVCYLTGLHIRITTRLYPNLNLWIIYL